MTPTALTLTAAAAGGLAAWSHLRAVRLRRQLAELRHAATHDPLTGLPNRAGLAEAWQQATHRRPALLMLDLDGFKPVNDQHGHAAGDELLTVIATRLHRAVAPGTAARLGGDEFAAIVNGHDPAATARAVAAAVARPTRLTGGATVTVTASIGLTWTSGELPTVLATADAAMYRAKTLRLGVAVYDPRRDDRTSPTTDPRPMIRTRNQRLPEPVLTELVEAA